MKVESSLARSAAVKILSWVAFLLVTSSVPAQVAVNPGSFCYAVLAKKTVKVSGGVIMDSFNSQDPNQSTGGQYDPSKRGDEADIASIDAVAKAITDSGSAEIFGHLFTSASGSVSISGKAAVGNIAWISGGNRGIEPGWYSNNFQAAISDAALPAVAFAPLPLNAGTVNGTNYTFVVTSGFYQAANLSLSGHQSMCINGNVVLYFPGSFSISGQAFIFIAPGSTLTVYLGGQAKLSGRGTVNGTGLASNCSYIGLPSCTSIENSGASQFIGTFYAPEAAISLTGGGNQMVNFAGAVVGNSVTLSGNFQFHCDQGLCVGCVAPAILQSAGNQTSCPGTTANFNANAIGTDLTYQWYQGTTLLSNETNSTLTLTNVSAANAGTYNVVISGACGGSVTNSGDLMVNSDILVSGISGNQTVCPGGTAIFSVTASGTGLTYQWYQGANALNNQTNSTLTLTNVGAASAGTYNVVITGACSAVSTNATLTVNSKVSVSTAPGDQTVCPKGTAIFSVIASGTDLAYQWYDGTTALNGETNNTLTLSDVNAAKAGIYSVVITDACGNAATNSAALAVSADTLVTEAPVDSTNCPGTTAYFNVSATGAGLTYQWFQGTNALPDQTSNSLTLTNVTATNAGIYSVTINNACGNSVSKTASLVVNQTVSVAPLPNVTNLLGSTATFTAMASGTGPFSYQWYQGATALFGQTNSTLTLHDLQATNGGAYYVSVTGECGIVAATGFLLTIHLPPVVNITYPTNGQVFVAPATFDVMADAKEPDGTITNVQFFSSTNGVDFAFLGETNNTPYLTIESNLPAGTYTLMATAADNLGATAQSPLVTIEVVPPQPPNVSVIGNLTLNVQDGYQWLSNVVCVPIESDYKAVRVYINDITNSAIQVVNATGTNDGVPYIESPAAIEPGTCWTNVIMFYEPIQAAFSPTLTVESVSPPNAAGNPTGTAVPILPPTPEMLPNGTVLIEFASTNGAVYYVQYSSDNVNWSTSLPPITGTGEHMQWIDAGPPLTSSLPAANVTRYYRVILAQ